MSDATADPIGVPQDVLNAFLDCPGSLEDSLLAAVRAQNAALAAENERLKAEKENLWKALNRLEQWSTPFIQNTPMSAETVWREFPEAIKNARAALGDKP